MHFRRLLLLYPFLKKIKLSHDQNYSCRSNFEPFFWTKYLKKYQLRKKSQIWRERYGTGGKTAPRASTMVRLIIW